MIRNDSSTDAVFEALADGHRRAVLSYLLETGEASVKELADAVANRRAMTDGGETDRAVAVRLHHVHLPKLADAGIVDYEPGTGGVEYVGDSKVADLLATASRRPIPE